MAELKDYGLQYVDPNRVRIDPPVAEGWQTTKDGGGGMKRDQIDNGLDRRKDVSALYDRGYSDKDFERLRESADPNERAIGDSQRMFWGDHPITVSKVGDDIISDNGRHRLDTAQARSETSLPMRVHAAADDPEFADRKFDAARHPRQSDRDRPGDSMSERGQPSPETPELNNTRETRPQVDEHPDLRAQREDAQKETGKSGDAAKIQASPQADVSANEQQAKGGDDRGSKYDPMDGQQARLKADADDRMDGASDVGRKPGIEAAELADTKRTLG